MSILDALFFGNLNPGISSGDLSALLTEIEEAEAGLLKSLPKNEKSLFSDYAFAQSRLNAETALEKFRSGFGLLLAAEAAGQAQRLTRE